MLVELRPNDPLPKKNYSAFLPFYTVPLFTASIRLSPSPRDFSDCRGREVSNPSSSPISLSINYGSWEIRGGAIRARINRKVGQVGAKRFHCQKAEVFPPLARHAGTNVIYDYRARPCLMSLAKYRGGPGWAGRNFRRWKFDPGAASSLLNTEQTER